MRFKMFVHVSLVKAFFMVIGRFLKIVKLVTQGYQLKLFNFVNNDNIKSSIGNSQKEHFKLKRNLKVCEN